MNGIAVGVRNHCGRTAVLAAVTLGMAQIAAGDFAPRPDLGADYELVLGVVAYAGDMDKSFESHHQVSNVFQPLFALADSVAAVDGSVISQNSGTQVSMVSPSLITFTGQVTGDFTDDFGGGYTANNAQSSALVYFDVQPPGLNVTASAEVLVNASNLQQQLAQVRLQRLTVGGVVAQTIFNRTLTASGSHSHTDVFNGFLVAGTYRIITAAFYTKDQTFGGGLSGFGTASYELTIVGNACGATQVQTFNLPAAGVPFNVSVQVGATTITVPVHLIGSIVAELLLDCSSQIIGISILSININVVEQTLLFDLGGGTSGTVSNLHFVADSLIGMLGPPAAVSGGCCGTLLGVLPHLTGSAVITTPGMVLPLTFDAPLGQLYTGIAFDLSAAAVAGGVGGDYELTLFLDHVLPSDIGLGKLNPTLILEGAITGSTAPQCAPADLDCNGIVNTIDLGTLLSSWTIPPQRSACGGAIPCPADINHDGVVNTLDLGILLSHWTL